MVKVYKREGGLKLFLYGDSDCYFFGFSATNRPALFESEKSAKKILTDYFGFFDKKWQIVEN